MTNVVTLELTGDESSLEDAIGRATQRVKDMDTAVATSAGSIEQSSGKMDRMSERADNLATRTGTLAGGIGALAGGMALLGVESDSTAGKVVGGISVAIGTLSGIMDVVAIATSSSTIAMIAQKAAMLAGSVATGVATAAQWALNIAMEANPIGLIIIAIVALIAVIVLIATKTTWFQTAWEASWKAIKIAAGAVADFFVDTVWHGGIEKAINWIGGGVSNVVGWFESIPGKIGSFFSGLGDKIAAPFKWAFNFVSDAWNNTVGSLQWTVPSWVPVIGGNTVGAPKLPHFHSGGTVTGPGPIGSEVLAVLQVGERVQTREQAAESSDGGVHFHGDVNVYPPTGYDFDQWLKDIKDYERRGGGGVNG